MHRLTKVFSLFILVLLISISFQSNSQTNNSDKGDQPPTMTMEVMVTDMENNPREGEKIVFSDTVSHKEYSGVTDKSGTFTIELPGGSTYHVKIKGLGESKDYQSVTIPELQPNKRYGKSRFTIKYEPPKVYTLDNVYFDVNKANLREASYKELNELVKYMERRSHIRVEIAGHTDNTGDKANNQKLSQQRANSVKQYLVNNGIDPSRVEAKGYGESRPVANNNTEKGRQKNRRTEVHIIRE